MDGVVEPPQRIACVWCPDWPVVAAGIAQSEPGAVLHANRVVASTVAARQMGVVRGIRRREAQSRCPELIIAERDLALEVRTYEEVASAIEAFTPRLELAQAGTCLFPTRGPSRYFGGDQALGEKIQAAVTETLDGRTTCAIGIADGVFTARLAARVRSTSTADQPGHREHVSVVPYGQGRAFLAPLPITTLEDPALTEVLWRLGIGTLGAFADLEPTDVLGRFGNEGVRAHRQAMGADEQLAEIGDIPKDMAASMALDPPVDRIDQAAFAARHLAITLHERLEARGSACSRITIVAESEHGEQYVRSWRHEGALSVAAMTDRVRWQLDGWLNAAPHIRPTGGLTLLMLRPDDLRPASGRQLGFWGGETEADQRAGRAVARLESLLGDDHVFVAETKGGREPDDQVRLVPAGTVELSDRTVRTDDRPWPGRLPAPSPVELFTERSIQVLDVDESSVTVTGRGLVSAAPRWLCLDDRNRRLIVSWAGPWLLDERWWDPEKARRRARFQLIDEDGGAFLVFLENGRWWLAGAY